MKTRNRMTRWSAATVALAALVLTAGSPVFAAPIPNQYRIGGFALGCQAYSFNRFTAFEAIEKTALAGGRVIEFYPGQKLRPDGPETLDQNLSDDGIARLKEKLKQHNIAPVNFGVVGLGNDEAGARRVFDFARKMGIGIITSEPDAAAMNMLEKLVKEYDIKLAIHNHPRRAADPNYRIWDPNYVLSLVQNRDPRVGACADTGHWVRSGVKPVDALRILRGRIISSHLKDLHIFEPSGHDVPFGTGVSDIKGILDELRAQGFEGNLSIEYEHNWDNSVPDIAQCIGFVRGYALANATSATRATTPIARPAKAPVALFNGRDFSGWTFHLSDPKAKMEDVWSVQNGVLNCKGAPAPAGYIRTMRDYTNYVLRLQWRFKKPGNSGVLLRLIGPDKVWPRSIEAQLQHQAAGDIWNIDEFPMQAAEARTNGRHTVKLHPTNERPVGEWNDYEITLDGGNLTLKVNGLIQNQAFGALVVPGKIALQSEGSEIEFRNIILTPLD